MLTKHWYAESAVNQHCLSLKNTKNYLVVHPVTFTPSASNNASGLYKTNPTTKTKPVIATEQQKHANIISCCGGSAVVCNCQQQEIPAPYPLYCRWWCGLEWCQLSWVRNPHTKFGSSLRRRCSPWKLLCSAFMYPKQKLSDDWQIPGNTYI